MKKILSYGILCLVVPLVALGGGLLFDQKYYAWVCLCVAILSCVPFFLHFERKHADAKKLILIAAMVAVTVVGRIVFTPVPGFKPVTAMVVITAMYFGGEAGFMTGALTALISNFYFGQGAWTPIQMFTWGLMGLAAGLLAKPMKRSRIALLLYGIVSGLAFSLLMDVWTVLWADGTFRLSRYLFVVSLSLEFTVVYCVSNVVFLLLFAKPIGKILERIKIKYGL